MIWDNLGQFKKLGAFTEDYPSNIRCFSAPNDDVHGAIMYMCQSASQSIASMQFQWNDKEINDCFYKAWNTEHIALILCLGSTMNQAEKSIISTWPPDAVGNEIYIGPSVHGAYSHTKDTVLDFTYTLTGSTNYSDSGERLQNNRLIIIKDRVIAAETRVKIDLTKAEMQRYMVTHAK